MTQQSLKGHVALITGCGRGLGRAMAEKLAELGADVAVHDISNEAPAEFGEAEDLTDVSNQVARRGVRTVAVTGNIADQQQVAAIVQKVESTLGPITLLVNNAGGDIAAK